MATNLILSKKPTHENAYVWLLMKGDSYLPGIVTSIYSVIRTKPNADLVVMVTDDVSDSAKKILRKYATHLFDIPYLSFETKALRTARQREMYQNWFSVSYTKWNMLALPYKKAIFVDGDTIHTMNTDNIFEMKAPAAPFASPFMKPLGFSPNFINKEKLDTDRYPKHGSIVTLEEINNMLQKNGTVLTANMVLLEPSVDDYTKYIQTIKSMQPFGYTNCNSMFDEQSIVYFYTKIKNKNWTVIHHRYNYIAWKDGFLSKGDFPRNIHYISETKPWSYVDIKYADLITWFKIAGKAIQYAKITANDIFLNSDMIEKCSTAKDTYINKFIAVESVLNIVDITTDTHNKMLSKKKGSGKSNKSKSRSKSNLLSSRRSRSRSRSKKRSDKISNKTPKSRKKSRSR